MNTLKLKHFKRKEKSSFDFVEFYIDDIPLSKRLDEFYNNRTPLLENWVGMLGTFKNKEAEKVKIKQLLLKNISEQDLRNIFPKTLSQADIEHGIENYKEELTDEEVILYGCAICGDYYCGGYGVKIEKDDKLFIWSFNHNKEMLQFKFNQYKYYEELNKYLKQLNQNN